MLRRDAEPLSGVGTGDAAQLVGVMQVGDDLDGPVAHQRAAPASIGHPSTRRDKLIVMLQSCRVRSQC
jgi:hypothetical protein